MDFIKAKNMENLNLPTAVSELYEVMHELMHGYKCVNTISCVKNDYNYHESNLSI